MTTNYEPGTVVNVPFPFIDRPVQKRRPALVLASQALVGNNSAVIMAMITSAKRSRWESDIPIAHLQAAGLNAPSVVRLKLFTIDTAFILQIRGSLADEDRAALAKRLKQLFSYWKE